MHSRQFKQRVIALTIALVLVTPLSAIAAQWQWNRHLERDSRNDLIVQNAVQDPVNISELATSRITPEIEWRQISVSGHFEQSKQKLWRKQALYGEPGFIVVTPFVTSDGKRLLVKRGWVAADGKIPTPEVDLQVSSTIQTIVARARLIDTSFETDPSDLPNGQTNDPATMFTDTTIIGLFDLVSSESRQTLTTLDLPERDAGPHVGYVGQWIIIGISAIGVYITVLRRLRSDYQAKETKSE
jgi:cytochrome oxidase assembly protein ShyY1